jgi:MFS-type transporter involved in bile tolerance (Atg22 family)
MMTGGSLFFTFSGVVVGPPLFGIIVSITGSYSTGYLAFAACTLISGMVLAFTQGKKAT